MGSSNQGRAALIIARDLMTHSTQPLSFAIIYTCTEQYTNINLKSNHTDGILINIYGDSILLSDNLLFPYSELYQNTKTEILKTLAEDLDIGLSKDQVRQQPVLDLMIGLLEKQQFKIIPDTVYKFHIEFCNQTIAQINLDTNAITLPDGHWIDLTSANTDVSELIDRLALQINYLRIADSARALLTKNTEWQKRYLEYGNQIIDKLDQIKSARSAFREWSPLYLYLNVSNAKNAGRSVNFELRFLGQTVAKLVAKENIVIDTSVLDKTNKRDFDCEIQLRNSEWDSCEAREFRKHYKNRSASRNTTSSKGNEEHRIESLLLTEFSKKKDKLLKQIKPVLIGGVRFPMPTPLSASNHKSLSYSGHYGGGVDILTRTGTGGSQTRLCIMELKDEYSSNEPPREVMKQAVSYATFIRELLRSDAGPVWWRLMGFGGNIPTRLILFASVVMPLVENPDKSFSGISIPIDQDTIQLHYLYFSESQNSISDYQSSII